jgi:hypothetical protein
MIDVAVAVVAVAAGIAGGWLIARRRRRAPAGAGRVHRILLPFTGAAIPLQCELGMPPLEAIEQAAARADVPVDARVARGRTYRHALERLLDDEPVDRVIVSATGNPRDGLTDDDLVWLLQRAPAEVLILRPDFEDHRKLVGTA